MASIDHINRVETKLMMIVVIQLIKTECICYEGNPTALGSYTLMIPKAKWQEIDKVRYCPRFDQNIIMASDISSKKVK